MAFFLNIGKRVSWEILLSHWPPKRRDASLHAMAPFVRSILPVLAVLLLTISGGWAVERVVIDPGHGGKDDGAKRYGVKEKDVNLDVAKRLERILIRRGIQVVLTRRDDRFVPLEERAKIANRYRDALFVSVHFNAHRDTTVKGIETFYATPEGQRLAQGIQNLLVQRTRTTDRGVKVGKQYAVLNKTRVVSVLVECGFLSNTWERRRCNGAWYRQSVAEQIAKGILIYQPLSTEILASESKQVETDKAEG